MERCEIVYRMSSDAAMDGIAVHEVADVMYAFAEAVDEAMKLSGETGRLDVNVRPFKQGSFITEFVLTYAQQGISLFSSQEATALTNVLSILGFMSGGVSVPVIVRFVRGRIDKCSCNDDGTYSYGDDDPVTVDEATHRIVQSPKVAKALKTIYVGPLVNIDKSINVTIQSRQEFDEGRADAGTTTEQSDIEVMEDYESIAVDGVPEEREEISSTAHGIPVHPCSGPYDGGENGYSFSYLGDKWSRVQIHDLDFLLKLESGKVRFMRRDLLIVDVDIVQTITKSGKESVKRTITKVHEYRPYEPAEQLSLDEG